jgi:hypothetical protein
MWSSCPHQFKLHYIDKLSESTSNIHNVFGTSMHEVIQSYLKTYYNISKREASLLDLDGMLLENLKTNYAKEQSKITSRQICTQDELTEFYIDGTNILTWFSENVAKIYPRNGYELLSIELPLNMKVRENINFIGFIDIVLRDKSSNNIIIVDIKTSTKGWGSYQKNDKIKNAQILLYKKFYSDIYKVPLDSIEVEFHILRRKLYEDSEYKIPYISKHIPANGSISIKKAHSEFEKFINTVFTDTGSHAAIHYAKNPGENGNNCKWCEFKSRNMCDGIPS